MTMTEDDDDVDIMTTTMKTPMAWPYGRPYGVGGYCLPQGVKEWQRQANRMSFNLRNLSDKAFVSSSPSRLSFSL